MWLVYIALLAGFIYLIDKLLMNKRQLELVKKFNGAPRFPIIGNMYMFFGLQPKDQYNLWMRKSEEFLRSGLKIARLWVANDLEISIECPKLLEVVLTNTKFLSKSWQYSFLHDSLGEGLLFSTDQKWFTRRRIITPTFHFKILEQFFDVFIHQNEILMKKIEDQASGKAFDIFPLITASTMNSIIETAMGCELKSEDFAYLTAVKELGHLVSLRFLTPWMRIKFLHDLSSNKRQTKNCAKIMHEFTTRIIENRRKLLENTQTLGNLDDDDVGLKKKMCLLDVLLQSTVDGMQLSNKDIQEEVDTFTFAGHDTTTNAICFTLFTISKFPEVQRKLNEEIEQLIGDGELNMKNINDFKYLDLVIKETLRLYPPVPIISRRLHEEVDFGDFIAPANANYNLMLYTLFKNPDIFENPEEFIPERFLLNDKSPYAFIPFSAGQRNCIGQKFAMLNIKNNIINILRKFEVIPGNIEPILEINVTLKCDGIFVGFRKK